MEGVADTPCFVEVPGYLPSEVKAELNGKAVLSVGEFADTCRLWRRAGALFISPSVPVCAGTLLVGDQTLPNLQHDSYRVLWGCSTTLSNEVATLGRDAQVSCEEVPGLSAFNTAKALL